MVETPGLVPAAPPAAGDPEADKAKPAETAVLICQNARSAELNDEVEEIREHRVGRHEGAPGLKPPITIDLHDEALLVDKRGRHEHDPPVFLSSFAGDSESYVIPATGGWFATSRAANSGSSGEEVDTD